MFNKNCPKILDEHDVWMYMAHTCMPQYLHVIKRCFNIFVKNITDIIRHSLCEQTIQWYISKPIEYQMSVVVNPH